jgi:hypothetical protein
MVIAVPVMRFFPGGQPEKIYIPKVFSVTREEENEADFGQTRGNGVE